MERQTMLMAPWVNGDGIVFLREVHEDGPRGALKMERLLAPGETRPVLVRVVSKQANIRQARNLLSHLTMNAPTFVGAFIENRELPAAGLAPGFAIETERDGQIDYGLRNIMLGTRFGRPGSATVQSLALDRTSAERRLAELKDERPAGGPTTIASLGGYPEHHPEISSLEWLLLGEPRIVLVGPGCSFAND